jgi:dihydroorotase
VWEAQKRGIIFDVGYGGISFAFSQAIPAIKSGFFPNTISTDIHTGSMNNAMKDMLTTMSKFLVMGMELQAVIQASTWNSAKAIKREDLGHLSAGAVADVAVLTLRDGKFGYFDYTGYKIDGNKRLECEMTIRDGKIVYDLNGIANPIVVTQRSAASSTGK